MQNESNSKYTGLEELLAAEKYRNNYNEYIVENCVRQVEKPNSFIDFGAGIGTLSEILKIKLTFFTGLSGGISYLFLNIIYMKVLKIKDVKLPTRGTPQSAGLDFYIPNDFKPTQLRPNMSILIPTGIKANVPPGMALVAFNKSGIAVKKSLLIGACVIDEDYQGEIHIDLKNVGKETQLLNPGDKIIQVVCLPVNYVEVEEVQSEHDLFNGEITERGEGAMGSTGNN